MIAEPEAAPAAAPPSPDDPDAEEEEENPNGLYLALATTATLRTKDAAFAAKSAWVGRQIQLARARDVLGRLRRLPDDFWTGRQQVRRFRKRYGLSVDNAGNVLDSVESSIAREQEEWPLHLAVAAAQLDSILYLEKAARKQADLSEMERVTSFLASVSLVQAAPEPLQRRNNGKSRVDLLENEVREAGISSEHGLAALTLALQERLAREDEGVRAAAAWARAERQLPRNDAAANAQLAEAMSQASLGHLKTLAPQNDEDRVVYEGWKSQGAHAEALRKNNEWTSAEPSGLATVGRTTRFGHSGTDLGLQYDYRVPLGDLDGPCPHRADHEDVPTVVQPASALARPASLHGLVDCVVKGEKLNAWRRG